MLSYKLYTIFKDIIDNAYPEKEYPDNKFKKFFFKIVPKEMKTIHGRYYPSTKKIEIVNLSRPTGHIVTTSIHEVAHHIDHCLRNDSDHTKEFYVVMKKLLITAMGMGIITKEDVLTVSDSNDKDRLIKYFGDIKLWSIPDIEYNKAISTIKVKNCFKIKDQLKNHGYYYDGIEQLWEKDVDNSDLGIEKKYLSTVIDMSNVTVCLCNELDIQAVYYIMVFNSFEHKEYLKKQGYLWNGYGINKNSWNKKILARNKDEELKKIESLSGVEIKVQARKQKKAKKGD